MDFSWTRTTVEKMRLLVLCALLCLSHFSSAHYRDQSVVDMLDALGDVTGFTDCSYNDVTGQCACAGAHACAHGVRSGERGACNLEDNIQSPDDVTTIACVGDSITAGGWPQVRSCACL